VGNFIQITPFIHVTDLEKAIAFFTDILGFEVTFRLEDYAFLRRETVGIRIVESHGQDGAPPGNRRFAYYVDVRDVDALYRELKPKLDTLPSAMSTARPIRSTANANFWCLPPTATSSPLVKRSDKIDRQARPQSSKVGLR
jgi:hypothetical protein